MTRVQFVTIGEICIRVQGWDKSTSGVHQSMFFVCPRKWQAAGWFQIVTGLNLQLSKTLGKVSSQKTLL